MILIPFSLIPSQSQKTKIKVYFLNFTHESPVAISEEIFWSNEKKKYMDTLIISDNNLSNSIKESVKKLKVTSEDIYVGNKVAILISKERNGFDTLYTHDFEKFRLRNQIYIDTVNNIKKMLSGFSVKSDWD